MYVSGEQKCQRSVIPFSYLSLPGHHNLPLVIFTGPETAGTTKQDLGTHAVIPFILYLYIPGAVPVYLNNRRCQQIGYYLFNTCNMLLSTRSGVGHKSLQYRL